MRAYHGAELPYTFGTHPSWMPTTDVDRALTDKILGYWTSFAATGDPNGPVVEPERGAPEIGRGQIGDKRLFHPFGHPVVETVGRDEYPELPLGFKEGQA